MKSTNLYVMAGELWITLHLLVHLFQTAVIRLGWCLSAPHSDIFRIKLISQTGEGNYRSGWKAITNKTSTMQEGKHLVHSAILAVQICLQESEYAPYWIFHQSDFPGNTSPPSGLIYLLIAPKGAFIIHREWQIFITTLCSLLWKKCNFGKWR